MTVLQAGFTVHLSLSKLRIHKAHTIAWEKVLKWMLKKSKRHSKWQQIKHHSIFICWGTHWVSVAEHAFRVAVHYIVIFWKYGALQEKTTGEQKQVRRNRDMGEIKLINHYTEARCKQRVTERDQMSQCLISSLTRGTIRQTSAKQITDECCHCDSSALDPHLWPVLYNNLT